MTLKHLLLAFSFFLCCLNHAYAQDDVESFKSKLYLKDGTALKVTILNYDGKTGPKKVTYRLINGAQDSLKPSEAMGFDLWGEGKYVSVEVKINGSSTHLFLEEIKSRDYEIYKYDIEDSLFFVVPKTQHVEQFQLTRKKFKAQLVSAYGLEPSEVPFLEQLRFNEDQILLAIRRFEKKDYTPYFTSSVSVESGFYASLTFMNVPAFGSQVFPTDYAASFGVLANLPLAYSAVSLDVGVTVASFRYLSEVTANEVVQYDFSYNQLEFPLALRYTFSKSHVRPYLGLGLNYIRRFGGNFNRIVHIDQDSSITVDLAEKGDIARNTFGLRPSFGISVLLPQKGSLYIESRFTYALGFNAIEQDIWQVAVGYRF